MKVKVRNVCAFLLASILILCGCVRRARKRAFNGEFILSVYFHNPSRKEFETCVKWFKKHRFRFLSIADLQQIVQQRLPFPKGAVVLTLDDGWQSNEANVVEVANQYQVPVTIFVSTEPVEKGTYWWSYIIEAQKKKLAYPLLDKLKKLNNDERLAIVKDFRILLPLRREALTIEQVRKVAESKYVTIGGHTHTHPILINCSAGHVYDELALSKEKLESWTDKEVTCFSYPNGDYGEREKEILKDLNYKLAFSSQPVYMTPGTLKDIYTLPRFGFLENASFAENICRIVGVWKPFTGNFRTLFSKNQHSNEVLIDEHQSKSSAFAIGQLAK